MKQIDTPEFKRWFGDSKVVDSKGLPLVVYHGTSSLDFSTFKPGSGSASGAAAFGTGIYFSDSAKKVSIWSGKKQGARIYPVYLSIQNPAIFKSESEYFKAAGFTYDRFFGDIEKRDAFNATLKAIGHDGIIVNRTQLSGKTKEYVVFEPTQIKSAIGNRGTFDPEDPDITNPLVKYALNYTDPAMRERLKRKIMAGDRGGRPGQWSARKAQLLAAEYEKAGGGYTGGRSKAQRSLTRWTKQDWRTKSGKPSLETGERYLPAKAIERLSPAEYAATSRAKREATGQFSRQPRRIAEKTKEFRNPMTNTVRKKLAPVIEPDDRILCYDTATGEDFYRLWDIIHTAMPMTKEALVEVEGMLDDDGVLVIESGESPAGLQDHFRKATRYNGLLLVQGPKNPEQARIETEKLRRELE